jgi:hypothetical protein
MDEVLEIMGDQNLKILLIHIDNFDYVLLHFDEQ